MSKQRKNRHICFSFCWRQVIFCCQYPFFYPVFSINLPFLVNQEVWGPPCGERSCGNGRPCLPPQNKGRVFARSFMQGGWGILMGSRGGYRVCGCSTFRRTLIAVPFSWTHQNAVPLQESTSFSCQGIVICLSSQFEPCPLSLEGGVLIRFPNFWGELEVLISRCLIHRLLELV